MAPIPEGQRYGSSRRNFTVWFAPNMELSGVFTGTLSMLNFNGPISITPVDKKSEDAPDHRVFAGPRQTYEVGAGWSMVAKSSGETYINCKLAAPEFGQHTIYSRLVKLEQPTEDGGTHIMLWEPRS